MSHRLFSSSFSSAFAVVCTVAGIFICETAFADISVSLSPSAPSANIVQENNNGTAPTALTIYPARTRFGVSFKALDSYSLSAITVKVAGIKARAITDFNLSFYKLGSATEVPNGGSEFFNERGSLSLSDVDNDSYLTFHLPTPIEVVKGKYYAFVFAAEALNGSFQIVTESDAPYPDGRLFSNAGEDSVFEEIGSPTVIYFFEAK